jgi:magnesium transporter
LIAVYVYDGAVTRKFDRLDPAWLAPGSGVTVWVDLQSPTLDETRILTDVFHFHELAVEDAIAEIHHPKVDPYPTYLYVVLHGIDFEAQRHRFNTKDVDFFIGEQYLVTVHPGLSRSIGMVGDVCSRNVDVLAAGPAALMHRILDAMVDNYRPEVDKLSARLDDLEREVFRATETRLTRRIIDFKRDVASLRRVVLPQRDVVARLARREFPAISEGLSYRFRDVYDHLVRLTEEATLFQDRISSLLDAHLSIVSNQLNTVMKVLTVMSTLFMPMTVLTGLYGMNVDLPHFPGGNAAQFWWIVGILTATSVTMLVLFRRNRWI